MDDSTIHLEEDEEVHLPYGGKLPDEVIAQVKSIYPVILSAENPVNKIELINTLHHKVITFDADGEFCYYVVVRLDMETVNVLQKLGATNADIMHNARWSKEDKFMVIDLTLFGFCFANWWSSESGFSLIDERKCRVCGCTQNNACPGGCYWVDDDLCNRCAVL